MLWETRALNVLITSLIMMKYPMLLLKDKLEEKIAETSSDVEDQGKDQSESSDEGDIDTCHSLKMIV